MHQFREAVHIIMKTVIWKRLMNACSGRSGPRWSAKLLVLRPLIGAQWVTSLIGYTPNIRTIRPVGHPVGGRPRRDRTEPYDHKCRFC